MGKTTVVKKKILLTRSLPKPYIKKLQTEFNVEIHNGRFPIPETTLKKKIKDKFGLICFPYDKIGSEVIESAKKLEAISTFSVGYDHIDIELATKKGIVVSYTPDVLTNATADLTMSMILGLLRRTAEGDRLIRNGKWNVILGPFEFLGDDLENKTVGILGLGRIGKMVAKRLRAFDIKGIVYHNRKRLNRKEERKLGARYVTFEELLRKSDILSVHLPYSKETHELLTQNSFRKMKSSAFLVNTARGKILRESDLVSALRKNEIKGAALDVFHTEPINKNNRLTKLENVLLCPHIGSATKETRHAMAEICISNLSRSIKREKPHYSVNWDNLFSK